MVSITSWTRLEARCRDGTLQDGLEATLHDPLWMLARQWQFGEFEAHDGGTVVQARIHLAYAPLTRYRPAASNGDAHPYDPRTHPLEAVVEGEAPVEAAHGSQDVRAAAEAGLHFARLLHQQEAGGYAEAYRAHYALRATEPGDGGPESGEAARFLAIMAGRVIDGARLYADVADLPRRPGGALADLPPEPPVAEEDRDTVGAVAGRWLDWYEETHGGPDQPPSAWTPERMTHEFVTSAVTHNGEVALAATGYPGGRLDWYTFDHAPDVALRADAGDEAGEPRDVVTTVLPGPVRYRGMPTTRWWEFEDARADFGAIATSPEDLARLLFIELAITYGNDWFLIPVDVEVGSLCEVQSLVVTDTFGQRTLIRHHADVDGPDGLWRMFRLTVPESLGDDRADGGQAVSRTMLLAPALAASHRGPAVEEVLLRRDEIANLAWAVERTVPGALGQPSERAGAAPAGSDQPPLAADAPYIYRLATEVPKHWFPLVPVGGSAPGSLRLVRGRMHTTQGRPGPEPQGTLLRPGAPLSLFDEDVPRAGARITRRDERTRWTDGSTHLWRARRRWTGGGEAWSGLRHDIVEAADRVQE